MVALGFVASLWALRVEATDRQLADCQSLNDRTRFGLMSRQNGITRINDNIDVLEERVNAPFNPTTFPGYDDLDPSTQAFVNGLTARSRETALIQLADARDELEAAEAELSLYEETIPLLDCNGNDDIDDGDFTGR